MEKIFSIIIPVYNGEQTIEQCIRSILNQKFNSIEIIVVDNNSNDSTKTIVKNLQNIHKQIIYIKENTKGVSFARNRGIEEATGKYLIFLDADDTHTDKTLNTYYQIAQNSGSQFIMSNFNTNIKNYNRNINSLKSIMNKNEALRLILKDFRIQGFCWNKVFELKIIKENNIIFPTNQNVLEDLYFCYTYLKHVNEVCYTNAKLINYFQFDNSSAMFSLNFASKISAIKVYRVMLQEVKHERIFEKKIINNIKSSLFLYSLILFKNICKTNDEVYIKYRAMFKKVFNENLLCFLLYSNSKKKYLFSGIVAKLSPSLIQNMYKLIKMN